jgi:hypothetical protein
MWRRLLLSVALVGLFFSSFASASAHAQTLRPLQTGCGLPCGAQVQYGPGSYAYGGSIIVTVSNPNLPSDGYWFRSLFELNTSNNGFAQIIIVKNGSNFNEFGCPAGGPYYLMEAGKDQSSCIPAPAGDINNPATLKIGDYVSNGGGNLLQVIGSSSGNNHLFVPYSDNAVSTWNQKTYGEVIEDSNITTHLVWGSVWSFSSWYDSGFHQHYDTIYPSTDYSVPPDKGPPPAMYWNDHNNPGGDLYSCVYDTTSSDPPCVPNH